MNPFLPTLVLLAGLTGASSGVAGQQSAYPVSVSAGTVTTTQQFSAPQVLRSTVITSGDSFIGAPFLPEQAQENVLVVPTPDLPVESLADLTEDLTVMCRIFDKAVLPDRPGVGFVTGARGADLFRYYTLGQTGPQALYLDGYGALFFIHVAFPLVPTEPQEPSQAKPKESADPVWSQTIQEMTGQPAEKGQTGRSAQTYDPQKVENLKRTLIQTLAHASNIRMRRPQDMVTLVVGALDDSKAPSSGRSRRTHPGTSDAPAQVGVGSSAAFLVMRVTKANVDAFAKGQLTAAQFTEKVQTLWSRPSPSEPQGEAPQR